MSPTVDLMGGLDPRFTLKHTITLEKRTENVVVSDPFNGLVGHAKDIIELHLGNRNIDKIGQFETFKNLEVLWLNKNKIRTVSGLGENKRIRALYLQDNRIESVSGSIPSMTSLQVLLLNGNRIKHLADTIKQLKLLTSLEQLNLCNNPCAEESNYRRFVIFHMPWLKILDRHEVKETERADAKAFYEGSFASTIAFLQKKPDWVPSKSSEISACERNMMTFVRKVEKKEMERLKREEAMLFVERETEEAAREERNKTAPMASALDFLSVKVREKNAERERNMAKKSTEQHRRTKYVLSRAIATVGEADTQGKVGVEWKTTVL